MNTLLPFQEEGVTKMLHFLKKSNACYNASDCGCGKTIMAIEALNRLSCGRVIVVSPAVMRLTWCAEIKKWTRVPNPRICTVLTGSDARESNKSNFTIISYDLAATRNIAEYLGSQPWDALIIDEAQYVKNRRAKRTIALFNHLWPKARFKIALSGTPFTSSVVDGFTAFHHMAPDLFPNFHQFAGRYSYQKSTPWGPRYFGLKNGEELSKLIRGNFFIRYKKEDVLKDLPEKLFNKILLPESLAIKLPKTEKEKVDAQALAILASLQNNEVPKIPTSLAQVRRLQAEAKVKPILEFVTDLLEQSIPIALFAYHRSVINRFEVALAKFKPLVITGDTSATDRFNNVKDFQDGKSDLIILQLQAGGVGITLTRSSNAVFAELSWSPGEIHQCYSRLDRIGQKNAVQVHYFVVSSSIDERILDTVVAKSKTFATIIDKTYAS